MTEKWRREIVWGMDTKSFLIQKVSINFCFYKGELIINLNLLVFQKVQGLNLKLLI